MSAALAVYEDVSVLPKCPRCKGEIKLRRCQYTWVAYEPSPINKVFLSEHTALLPLDRDFVFVPHALVCGAVAYCPADPGLSTYWFRNRDRLQLESGLTEEHPIYGQLVPTHVDTALARMHNMLTNNRPITLTKGEAVALIEGFQKLTAEPEPVDNQCTAVSSKTKKRCGQKTNDPSGKCFAHQRAVESGVTA